MRLPPRQMRSGSRLPLVEILRAPAATYRPYEAHGGVEAPRVQFQRGSLRGEFGGLRRHDVEVAHHAVAVARHREREGALCGGERLVFALRLVAEMVQQREVVLDL